MSTLRLHCLLVVGLLASIEQVSGFAVSAAAFSSSISSLAPTSAITSSHIHNNRWSSQQQELFMSSSDSATTTPTVYSWTDLQAQAAATAVGAALNHEHTLRQAGRGSAHVSNTLRLFDAPSDDTTLPPITLFRDQAGWCPYCEKVSTSSTRRKGRRIGTTHRLLEYLQLSPYIRSVFLSA
jgi:hypothetical protein